LSYTTNDWEAMVFGGVGSTHKVKPLPVTEDTATVVELRRRERDRYGEGFEGDGGCYVIFQVGNRFFKKKFWESSYSENDVNFYNDEVEEVFGEVKTVTTFIPKEG
jgi:hypothetical protein